MCMHEPFLFADFFFLCLGFGRSFMIIWAAEAVLEAFFGWQAHTCAFSWFCFIKWLCGYLLAWLVHAHAYDFTFIYGSSELPKRLSWQVHARACTGIFCLLIFYLWPAIGGSSIIIWAVKMFLEALLGWQAHARAFSIGFILFTFRLWLFKLPKWPLMLCLVDSLFS